MNYVFLLVSALTGTLFGAQSELTSVKNIVDKDFYTSLESHDQTKISEQFESFLKQAQTKNKSLISIPVEEKNQLRDIFAHEAAPVLLEIETPEKRADKFLAFLQDPNSCGNLLEMKEWNDLKFGPFGDKNTQDLWRLYIVSLIDQKAFKEVIKKHSSNPAHVINSIKTIAQEKYQSIYEVINFEPGTSKKDNQKLRMLLQWSIRFGTGAWRVHSQFENFPQPEDFLSKIYFKLAEFSCKTNAGLTLKPEFDTQEKAKTSALLKAYIQMILKNKKLGILCSSSPFLWEAPSSQQKAPPFDDDDFGAFLTYSTPLSFILKSDNPNDLDPGKELTTLLKQIGENPQKADQENKYSLTDSLVLLQSLNESNYFETSGNTKSDEALLWEKNLAAYLQPAQKESYCRIV